MISEIRKAFKSLGEEVYPPKKNNVLQELSKKKTQKRTMLYRITVTWFDMSSKNTSSIQQVCQIDNTNYALGISFLGLSQR